MKTIKPDDHKPGSLLSLQATCRSRPLRWVLLLAATLTLSPGPVRAIEARGRGVGPEGSITKLLTYADCAVGIGVSIGTGLFIFALIGCAAIVADEVENGHRP